MGSLARKKVLEKGAGIKLVIAVASIVAGVAFLRLTAQSNVSILCLPMFFVGVVAWYWGLGQYCMSKGYSGVVAVLGILGVIGLVLILVLPDKYQLEAPPVMEGAYPRPQPGSVTTII